MRAGAARLVATEAYEKQRGDEEANHAVERSRLLYRRQWRPMELG